jgi:hypothetical protein
MSSIKGKNPGDLPVGQHWIQKWPERTAEPPPDIEPESWTVKVTGLDWGQLRLSGTFTA